MDATIRLAANNVLDKNILRAFLHAVGLFPVGSWLLLSSGETARVVGTCKDATRYDRPIITVLYGRDGSPLPTPRLIQHSDAPDLTITQVLPQDALLSLPIMTASNPQYPPVCEILSFLFDRSCFPMQTTRTPFCRNTIANWTIDAYTTESHPQKLYPLHS